MFIILLGWLWFRCMLPKAWGNYGNRTPSPGAHFPRHPPKPEWVRKKVIRLAALMPEAGCRTIAHAFNRLHERRGMTVSKSYVNDVVRKHRHEIKVLRRRIKHRRPRPVPHNLIWGVDLTGKTDAAGNLHNILGIVEHRSRSCLTLAALADKTSLTLLEHLIAAIKRYGKPQSIRTDNEAIFTSKLFRFGLWLLGIKHQRTEVACPCPRAPSLAAPFTLWQNGKVERFFGTLKERLNCWEVSSLDELAHSLHLFRFWYNHVRPHDYLDSATPAEVWQGRKGNPDGARWFEAWDGLLNGYWLPP